MALTTAFRVILKTPLDAALGEMAGGLIRYALISIWITALYPAIFAHLLNRRTAAA